MKQDIHRRRAYRSPESVAITSELIRDVVGSARLAPFLPEHPTPPLPAFLTCTTCAGQVLRARRRKCVQQRNCRGDGTSFVILHSHMVSDAEKKVIKRVIDEDRSQLRRLAAML